MRCTPSGRVQTLSAQQLYQDFLQLVEAGSTKWDLSNQQIQPELLIELFRLMREGSRSCHKSLALDLSANRLEMATAADFTVILKAMLEDNLLRLWVRFGYDIQISALKQAMRDVHAEDLYTNRITVSAPWAPASLLQIAHELKLSNDEMTISNDLQLKRFNAAEKIPQRKESFAKLKQMRQGRDTDDRLIEEGVTQAIADALQDADVILPSRYIYKSIVGDLDGLVAGRYKDQLVVVLIEAKNNMDALWKKAMAQLHQAKHHWEHLASCVPEELDESDLADYEAMHMNDLRNYEVMFGFGGLKFSNEVVNKHFADFHTGWFYVQANSSGQFAVQTVLPASAAAAEEEATV